MDFVKEYCSSNVRVNFDRIFSSKEDVVVAKRYMRAIVYEYPFIAAIQCFKVV